MYRKKSIISFATRVTALFQPIEKDSVPYAFGRQSKQFCLQRTGITRQFGGQAPQNKIPKIRYVISIQSFSGVPDLWDRNKILRYGDLSHLHVPDCIWVFFYFVWFVFIHHNFQFYFELCTYCNILDIYLLWNLNDVNYLLFYMKLLINFFVACLEVSWSVMS